MRLNLSLLAGVLTMTLNSLSAQTIDRTKPPETPPLPAFHLPALYETKLPNGLSVVLLQDARFPLVTVRLAFQAGSRFDQAGLPGLAEATASLLTDGTKSRTSRQIAEEMASIGGSINAHESPDTLTISASSLSENTRKLLEMGADRAPNANFTPHEVKLYKENRLQHLIEQRSQSEFLATEKLDEVVFGANPYGH